MQQQKWFDTIDEFYDRRGGRYSGESDFGVHWHDSGRSWPRYRVSVVRDTGDIYAIDQAHGKVELLGTVPPRPDPYAAAEEQLDGWSNVEVFDLDWVRRRV
jgi:hypothetical protein